MMNEQDRLQLSAYVDGQLDPEQSDALEFRLQQEPELREYLDQLRATDATLCKAFDSINDEPLPEALQQLLKEDISQCEAGAESKFRPSLIKQLSSALSFLSPQQMPWLSPALAATVTLVVGYIFGVNQSGYDDRGGLISQDLQPSSELVDILSRSPSGSVIQVGQLPAVSILPELSFMDGSGYFCRQYIVQQNHQAFRGIACMADQQWQNQLLVPADLMPDDSTNYQPASAYSNPVISQYLEQHMQGIALGKVGEQQQLDKIKAGQFE
ncbi:MAG: hypothetical protein MI756_15130 [Chromatiales bacterium]|nr:hypothetical protein [Chromatiales bacterium]